MKKIVRLEKGDISKIFYERTKIKGFPKEELSSEDWPESWKRIFTKDYPRLQKVELPKNVPPLKTALSKILLGRRSERNFSGKLIDMAKLGALLFYSAGAIPGERRWSTTRRFYPSAGARYPIEVYVSIKNIKGLENGLYHYNVRQHSLDALLIRKDLNKKIARLSAQDWISKANVVILLSGVFYRTQIKYSERGLRHVFLEAGHLGQNIYLTAEALKLKVCAIGGFIDNKINKIIDIDGEDEGVLYILALGT